MVNSLNDIMRSRLDRVRHAGQCRSLISTQMHGVEVTQGDVRYLSFCSNDYLGIIADGITRAPVAPLFGAGASRAITGNHPLHEALEEALATHKKKEAALLFGSGYLANIGTISALMGKEDVIFLDKLSHACMIDGARLSGATILRFRHNDTVHLEALLHKHRTQHRHCLIATESIFSMDGDAAPLPALRALANNHDSWLLVDDAHGFGLPHVDCTLADIVVGTCSKAIGTYGGYVAGSALLKDYLINHARSFLFTTALPEALCAATLHALKVIAAEPQRAMRVMDYARQLTHALGLAPATSPIIPLMMGESEKALALQAALKDAGILTAAIRPPTVPPRTARLRLSLSAAHTQEGVARLSEALYSLLR